MRITGGRYKGRKLICPPGVIRPAMDRMRESLFAVLGEIGGCSALDLYSGSGALGIETASRGGEPVVFVEKDRGKRAALARNLSFVRESTELHIMPVEHYLRRAKSRFDLIFADPPFHQPAKLDVLRLIAAKQLLTATGTLVIHLSRGERELFPPVIGVEASPPLRPGGALYLADSRVYGGSLLLLYGSKNVQ